MPSNSKQSSSSSRSVRDGRGGRNVFVWCGVVICTIITLAVILAGIVVFIGYLVLHPRVPYVSVVNGRLDQIEIDRFQGILQIQLRLLMRARNGNRVAHASFVGSNYTLSFDGEDVAQLVAPDFELGKNSSMDFFYPVRSSPVLGLDQADKIESELQRDLITFELKGGARVRWRVGRLGSFKFLSHLDCQVQFHASNRTYVHSSCTSKAK